MRSALLLPSCALLLAACTHHLAATTARTPAGPYVPTPDYYEAGGPVPQPTKVERIWQEPQSELWRVELPPRVPAGVADVPRVRDPIEIRIFLPRPAGARPRPLVVMFPVLGNRTLLMREFASGFVRQGYVAAVVTRKELEIEPARAVELAEKEMRVLMMRARQAIDWLVGQPQVDAERIGAFGLSAGGILALTLMGADPRVDACVAVWAGGPMADVLVGTSEDEFAAQAEAVQRTFGWTQERARQELLRVLRTDPVVLAPRIRREDVLLFIATDDDSVPTPTQWRLWEALDRPEMYELRGGHYTATALHFPYLLGRSQAFLGRRLGPP